MLLVGKIHSSSTRTDYFLQSSCIGVDLLSYDSKKTDKWEQYDWMAGIFIGQVAYLWGTIGSFASWLLVPAAHQSYYYRLSVISLSCNSRLTLIRLDCRKKNWSSSQCAPPLSHWHSLTHYLAKCCLAQPCSASTSWCAVSSHYL